MTLNSNDQKIVQICNGALATQNWDLFEEVYPMLRGNGECQKAFGCPEYAAEVKKTVNGLLRKYQQSIEDCDASDWISDDGGRKAAGFDGDAGDCGVRAAAIVCDIDYQEAHDLLNYNEEEDEGIMNMTLGEFLRERGWNCVSLRDRRITVAEAAREFENGLVVAELLNYGHFVGIVDSKYRDTWNSGELRANAIWLRSQQ